MVNCIFRLYSGSILLYMAVSVQALWTSFDFVSLENSKGGIVVTELKITRANKTSYGISGTFDVTADLNDDYDCEMKAYFSPLGNNKYTLMPYKVPRDACCKHMESTYWRNIETTLQDCSNIPPRKEGEDYCLSAKKGKYEVRNFGFNYYVVPQHADTGTYKIEIMMYAKGSEESSSMTSFIAKLY